MRTATALLAITAGGLLLFSAFQPKDAPGGVGYDPRYQLRRIFRPLSLVRPVPLSYMGPVHPDVPRSPG